jgi:ABC-type glycerol-3-phosphate transport system substrate-binding protein
MTPPFLRLNRRHLLIGTAAALTPLTVSGQSTPPGPTVVPPSMSGTTLRLLTWQRPVEGFDAAFEQLLREWADANGVGLTIDWVPPATMVDAVLNEVALGSGHDLIDSPLPLPQAEPALRDLTVLLSSIESMAGPAVPACTDSTRNPVTGVRWGIAYGWEPTAAIYRLALWQEAGYPAGPATLNDLLVGARWIWNERGVQLALGLTPTRAAEIAAQSMIWASGGAVQDADEQVVLASDATRSAMALMRSLFNEAATPVLLEWSEESHVDFMANGFGSYTIGSLHDLRRIASRNAELAADFQLAALPGGPAGGSPGRSMAKSMPTLMIPGWNPAPLTAEALVRHLVSQSSSWAMASQLAYLPAFPAVVPDMFSPSGPLANDPFDTLMPTRLLPLLQAPAWTVPAGWPGPVNPMIADGHRAGLLTTMMAEAATETGTDEEASNHTAAQFEDLAEPWRATGLMSPPGGNAAG